MKILTFLVLIIFRGGFFVSCQIEKCAIWNNILRCYRSFDHHKYCYETKPYSKTICCSQAMKTISTDVKSRKKVDLDQSELTWLLLDFMRDVAET